jgi:hypothetical protein
MIYHSNAHHSAIKLFKKAIRLLNQGIRASKVRSGLKSLIPQLSPRDIMHLQTNLHHEHISPSALLHLSTLHLEVLEETLTLSSPPSLDNSLI